MTNGEEIINDGPSAFGLPPGGKATETARFAPSADAIRAWLVKELATELGMPESSIDGNVPLENFPLDSLAMVALQSELSDWLGWHVPDTLFLELPTLHAVADYLAIAASAEKAATNEPATPFKSGKLLRGLQPVRPFFCLGGMLGSTEYQSRLAHALGHSYPYYGLQLPGHDGADEPIDQVEALAARCLTEIRSLQPKGPYVLGGHSFGGLVAYEMARQLREQQEEVRRVFLFDTFVLIPGQQAFAHDDATAIQELAAVYRLMQSIHGAPNNGADADGALFFRHDHFVDSLAGVNVAAAELHIAYIVRVYQASLDAMIRYQLRFSDVPVTLFKAVGGFQPEATLGSDAHASRSDPTSVLAGDRQLHFYRDDPMNGWERLGLRDLRVVYVPGHHFNMFSAPYIDTLAAVLRKCFEEAFG